jgi:amino acid transporter
MAKVVWGLGFIVLIIALVSSAIAGSNASSVSTTRVGYSLARIRMLPRVLARIHPRFGTPSVALHVQIALAVAYALVLGFVLKGPLNALVLQGYHLGCTHYRDLHLYGDQLHRFLSA